MPRQGAVTGKGGACDDDVEMPATSTCAGMTLMQRAVVADLEEARAQSRLQSCTQ